MCTFVLMKMYSSYSLYRCHFLRRLRYGRGRGVHSPLGYAMILSLVRPYATYYHFEQFPKLFATRVSRLVYRIIARCDIRAVVLPEGDPLVEVAKLAKSTVKIGLQPSPLAGRTLCIARKVEMLPTIDALNKGILLFLPTPHSRPYIKEWVEKLPSGLVLDLYEAILVVDMPRVKYLYRTSL